MSITVNLAPATRSGNCSLPLAALATETLVFSGADLENGAQVTVMLPDGTPVAIGTVEANAVEMNLNTKEAHEATVTIPVGQTVKAFLVIGDTDSLRFAVPALLQRNYLDDIVPPTESVPVYPTKAELDAILEAVQTAKEETQEILEKAEQIDATIGTVVDEFNSAVTAAETLINRTVTDGVADINTAKTGALNEIDAAKQQAEAQLTPLVDQAADAKAGAEAAQTAVEALKAATDSNAAATSADALTSAEAAEKAVTAEANAKASADAAEAAKETVTAAVDSAETARDEAVASKDAAETAQGLAEEAQSAAETAQHTAVEAAEAAEIALNNGCVYKVVDLGQSSIVNLKRETTIYKVEIGGSYPFVIYPPTLAEGEVIVFWLWLVMGEVAYELTLPATFIGSEPALAANTETLLAFMSVDGGATWQANLQWEKAVSA